MKPRNDNKSADSNDSEKTAVNDEVRNRRHLAMTVNIVLMRLPRRYRSSQCQWVYGCDDSEVDME